jgi:hypothetical protein
MGGAKQPDGQSYIEHSANCNDVLTGFAECAFQFRAFLYWIVWLRSVSPNP